MSADLVIVHLYPDMLRTYGDRGNVLTLRRRAEWRGFTFEVVSVSRGGEPMTSTARLVMVGGGTDRVQEALAPDLLGRGPELREAAARGAVVLGVCGGYQFLGRAYVLPDGREIEGIGYERVMLQHLAHDDLETVALIARELVPAQRERDMMIKFALAAAGVATALLVQPALAADEPGAILAVDVMRRP